MGIDVPVCWANTQRFVKSWVFLLYTGCFIESAALLNAILTVFLLVTGYNLPQQFGLYPFTVFKMYPEKWTHKKVFVYNFQIYFSPNV